VGLEQLVFAFLIVFALAAVFASSLKRAIITSGVFGMWAAFAYLLFHAPDVAVSEAVVASSLGTVLLILTIRNYDDLSVPGIGQMIWRRKGADLLIAGACALVLWLTARAPVIAVAPMREQVMAAHLAGPGGVNPVTSVLLHYRVLDTVLEALMLLISVLGVMHLTRSDGRAASPENRVMSSRHPTLVTALRILTPVLVVVGAALIVGDPNTPGGGFQGAGLLAAVVVGRYLVGARGPRSTRALETLEKVIFVLFVISVVVYLLVGLRDIAPEAYAPWTILMNGLLGLKVFCGLSIMFLYFAAEA
jgi:multicomponent Na+:H+ antiporter subunit B